MNVYVDEILRSDNFHLLSCQLRTWIHMGIPDTGNIRLSPNKPQRPECPIWTRIAEECIQII